MTDDIDSWLLAALQMESFDCFQYYSVNGYAVFINNKPKFYLCFWRFVLNNIVFGAKLILSFAVNSAPPPAPVQGGGGGSMLGGLGATIAQGEFRKHMPFLFLQLIISMPS